MEIEQIKKIAAENKYRVLKVINKERQTFLVLYGDEIIKPESFIGKNPIAVNVPRPWDLPQRLEDLQNDYKEYTGTDGSKVNWEIKDIK